MTGREYIQYILENRLENEEMIKEGKILGFMTKLEAAKKFGVGVSTINTLIYTGRLEAVGLYDSIFIPANAVIKETKDE